MSTLARIRTRRLLPMTEKRRRELQVLAEDDVMTSEQFQEWKRGRDARGAAFMVDGHELRCRCGSNVRATIVGACDLGWIVTTKDCTITEASCPKCSGTRRRELERDVADFMKRRPN